MADHGITVQFDENRVLERFDQQRLDRLDERDQVVIADVPGRHQQQPKRRIVQQVPIEEIMVFGDHDPAVEISEPDDLCVRCPVSISKAAGVHDVVAQRGHAASEPVGQLGIDEKSHAAEIGTDERVRVTNAAYSSDASTSSATRSG